MKVTIVYPKLSNIANTSPLIRALFFDAIAQATKAALRHSNIEERITVEFIATVGFNTETGKEIFVKNFGTRDVRKLKAVVDDSLGCVWANAYGAIEKMEYLIDSYGTKSPSHLFGAACVGEMQC